MTDTRGTFRLRTVRQNVLNNEYVPFSDVWLPNNGFGYSIWQMKGNSSKTNINTGVATLVGNNSVSYTNGCMGFSSRSSGYWAGGKSSARSSVKKIDYSTETVTNQIPNTFVPQTIYDAGAISAGDKSYLISGVQGGSYKSITYKMVYSTETWSEIPSRYTVGWQGEQELQGANATNGIGYAYGDDSTGSPINGAKITFDTDTWSTAYPSTFTSASNGTGNLRSSTHCYFVGGNGTPSPTYLSDVKKFTFSNETWAVSPSKMPDGVTDAASYPYNTAKGAVVGGVPSDYIGSGNPSLYTMSAAFTLTFATDTWDATSIASNADAYGYAEGNLSGISAAENNTTAIGTNLGLQPGKDKSNRWSDGSAEIPNEGYFGGGGSPMVTIVDRLTMSTETTARVPGMDTYEQSWNQGNTFASSPAKGYYNGTNPGERSSVWQLIYATDSRAHEPGMNTVVPFGYTSSTGHSTVGYIMGGASANIPWNGTYNTGSWVQKMTYASNTTSRIPANLPGPTTDRGTGSGATVASSSGDTSGAAYLTAGQQWPSQGMRSFVWKMTYATETSSRLSEYVPGNPGGTSGTTAMSGHSEASAGYFVGGALSPGVASGVLKFPWATETFASDGDSGMHRYCGGTGNQQAAYQGGGIIPAGGNVSNIRKFTYSTSTSSGVPATLSGTHPGPAPRQGNWGTGPRTCNLPSASAPLATPTSSITTVADSSLSVDGYWSGGKQSNQPSIYSVTDKVTFATDTVARVPGSNTSPGSIYAAAGTSSTTTGYTHGGKEPSDTTRKTRKLVYANGTYSQIPGADSMSLPKRYRMAAVNNLTHSYLGGGMNVSGTNNDKWDKFTFATETCATKDIWTTEYPLIASATALGNQQKGFVCGGRNQSIGDETSTVYKITYATDTMEDMPATLTSARGDGSLTRRRFSFGKGDVGYVCGGEDENSSSVTKITYATETSSFAPDLWGVARMAEAVSSNTAGYISGLYNTDWGGYKMPYATETWTQGPALPLSTARYYCSGFNAGMNGNAFVEKLNLI